MPQVFWDASALVKRYITETGSATVDAIFAQVTADHMTATLLGYTETAAIMRRKCNDRAMSLRTFQEARWLLQAQVLGNPGFRLLTAEDADILNAIAFVDQYSLNSSDAIILTVYLRHARASGETCVLIAADRRLLKAAAAEGLTTLNPQSTPEADVPAFLAGP